MKKFLIMSLTFLAFALIGCGSKKVTKAECETQEGKVWNEETKECEDKMYTITNTHNLENVVLSVVSGSNSLELAGNGGCAKIKESHFANLKVSFGTQVLCDSTNMMATEDNAETADVNEAETPNTDDDCTAGNYTITKIGPKLVPADAMSDSADCKALEGATEKASADTAGDDTAGNTADGATTATEGDGATAEAEGDTAATGEGEAADASAN